MLSVIGKAFSTFCGVKSGVFKWVAEQVVKYLKKPKKVKDPNAQKGTLSKIKDAVKSTIKDTAKDAAKSVLGKNYDKAKAFYKAIRDKISSWIQSFKDWWNSPSIQALKKFLDCAVSAGKAATQIYKTVKGFYDKITQLMAGAAAGGYGAILPAVNIFIDLLCNYAVFQKSVDALVNAVRATDPLQRYNYVGQFLGFLLNAIGTARRVRRARRFAKKNNKKTKRNKH